MAASAIKTIVSKKKRRHVEDGFNLDLSYISPRIIAMGFPAENVESLYRNSLDEVKKFLDQKHKDHYMIYNLCSERIYDPNKFYGRVAMYPFDDHHPPDFSIIQPFCTDVDKWLGSDPENIAVVHCKAGKGRTGVMICCYLLHTREYKTAEDVLSFYGHKRTTDHKGVTIPSQKRYISYYADAVQRSLEYKPVKMYLRMVQLDPVPNFGTLGNEYYVQFEVKQGDQHTFESPAYVIKRSDTRATLKLDPPLLLCGDVKIEFTTKTKLDSIGIKPKITFPKKEFHLWFNTYFVDSKFSSDLCHSVSIDNDEEEDLCFLRENGRGDVITQQTQRFLSEPTAPPILFADDEDEHVNCRSSASNGLDKQGKAVKQLQLVERHSTSTMGSIASDVQETEESLNGERELTNLLKHASISDDYLIEDRRKRNVTGSGSAPPHSTSMQHAQPTLLGTSTKCKNSGSKKNGSSTNASSASSSSSSTSSVAAAAAAVPGAGNTASTALATRPTIFQSYTQSFIEKRIRHSSVPQTAKSTVALPHISHCSQQQRQQQYHNNYATLNSKMEMAKEALPLDLLRGDMVSMLLTKPQIDKVFKDKQCKVYADNFRVQLILVRPQDQSDVAKYASSPVCSNSKCGSGDTGVANSSPESSSEEDDVTDSENVGASARGSIDILNYPDIEQAATEAVSEPVLRVASNVSSTSFSAITPQKQQNTSSILHHAVQSDWI